MTADDARFSRNLLLAIGIMVALTLAFLFGSVFGGSQHAKPLPTPEPALAQSQPEASPAR